MIKLLSLITQFVVNNHRDTNCRHTISAHERLAELWGIWQLVWIRECVWMFRKPCCRNTRRSVDHGVGRGFTRDTFIWVCDTHRPVRDSKPDAIVRRPDPLATRQSCRCALDVTWSTCAHCSDVNEATNGAWLTALTTVAARNDACVLSIALPRDPRVMQYARHLVIASGWRHAWPAEGIILCSVPVSVMVHGALGPLTLQARL